MRVRCLKSIILIFALGFSLSSLAQTVLIKPKPTWVHTKTPDLAARSKDGETGGYFYLLLDRQQHIQQQQRYYHWAYKIQNSEGVQEMSDISVDFDPSYEKLTFHQLVIHRDGEVINRLSPSAFRTIQREQSMDRYLYDGSYSAVVNLQDVRAGDVIEYAFSRQGFNPVFENHYAETLYFGYSVPFDAMYQRVVAPASGKLYTKYGGAEIKPSVSNKGNTTEYVWDLHDVPAYIMENNLPDWYDPYSRVELSDFETWADVAAWAAKYYTVSAGDVALLKQKTASRFSAMSKDSLIVAAIRFVQDDVRYLGFESGLNSHKPHNPVKVFDQRFGDCKDKSLLLSALLRAYDVTARPMLVHTTLRNHTAEQLPSFFGFNHCVVQIRHDGHDYYIDPTINYQGGTALSAYGFPEYGQGLVIDQGTTDLIALPARLPSDITERQTFTVDSVGGPATLSIRTTYTGLEADYQRSSFAGKSLESIQKSYKTFYANQYPEIQVAEQVTMTDDRAANVFTVVENYTIPAFWKTNDDNKDQVYCEFYAQTLESYFNVSKTPKRDAPYALSFPVSYHHHIQVKLPVPWSIANDSKSITSLYYTYKYDVRYNDDAHELSLYQHYETRRDHVPAEAVAKFVEDHGTMMGNLAYQLSYNTAMAATPAASSSALVVLVVGLALASGAGGVFYLYRNYDPRPVLRRTHGLPIGGWLILVAIGLTITPFRMIADLLSTQELYDASIWSGLWAQANYGLLALVVFEAVYNVWAIIFAGLLLALFFNRRSSLPRLITIFYAVTLTVTIMDTSVGIANDANDDAVWTGVGTMFGSFVAAAIWIPYFNLSQRVNETFVRQLHPSDDEDGL